MSATTTALDDAARQRLLEARPMWRIVLGQFVEHRMAVVGVCVIAFFLGVALLAPVISAVTGLDPNRQNVLARYQPLMSWEEASPSQRELRVEQFLRGGDRTALADHLRSLGLAGADVPREEVLYQVVSSQEPAQLLGGTPFAFVVDHEHESVIKMVIILCAFSWMQAARLVRGSILSIKEQEFVLAARVLGARDRTIIATHVVPNVIAPLLVAVTLGIGNAILFEAALSFLGLGIQPPTPSWGNMLHNAQEMVQHAPMLAILPGLLILFTVISFNYIGDGVRDAIDPRGIRR